MAAPKKHSHVALHAIQYHDKDLGVVEVKPGNGYTPTDAAETKRLLGLGAIRKAQPHDTDDGSVVGDVVPAGDSDSDKK